MRSEGAALGLAVPGGGPEKVGVRRRWFDGQPPAHAGRARDRHDLGEMVAVAVFDWLLVEGGVPACRVVGGRHQIPLARDEGDVCGERIRIAGAVAHAELQRPAVSNAKRIAAAVGALPAGEDALVTIHGRAWPDIGPEREGARQREAAVRVRDPDKAPQLRPLLGHGMRPVHRRVHLALDEARALGVLVAVDQANELEFHLVRALRAHHDVEPLARPRAEAVAIARQMDVRHPPAPSCGPQGSLFMSSSTRLRKTAWSASLLSA